MALELGGLGGSIGIFAIFVIIAIVLQKFSGHRALYGTGREKRLEREENLGSVARAIRALENRLKKEGKQEKEVKNEIAKDDKEEKRNNAPPSQRVANKAAEQAAEAAKSEGKAELATEALEGRGVGLLASVKSVMESVSGYLSREMPNLQQEERDIQSDEDLMRKLRNTTNFNTIDSRVLSYLRQIISLMVESISKSVEDEKQKEAYHGQLVNQLRDAASEARLVIRNANGALRILNDAKKKERKKFTKELTEISHTLRDKRRELRSIKKSKDADPAAIRKLEGEIRMLSKQKALVIKLNNQLTNTYRTMDRETREMKIILRAISNREKQVGKHEKSADKRETDVEKRYRTLSHFAQDLEESTKDLNMVHELAIEFSGKLNVFYKQYGKIISEDVEFDKEVRDILLLHITIAIQLEAYETMSMSLLQAEAGVEQGLASATEIVASIVGGQDQRSNLKQLVDVIKKAGGDIDYRTRVARYLRELTRRIEMETRTAAGQIATLIGEDNALLQEIEKARTDNSSTIGNTMGTMMNRKEQVDNRYFSQAEDFEAKLKERNDIAAKAYRQVRGLKARVPAGAG
jgi:hypothetical protein